MGATLAGACLGLALVAGPPVGARPARAEPAEREPGAVVIRLLPPVAGEPGEEVLIETLMAEPEVENVVFELDGEVVARRRGPPWAARVQLASPPREQHVRVEARGREGRLLGADEMVINRRPRPLRVVIHALDATAAGLAVRVELSLPDEVELERLELFVNAELRRALGPEEAPAGMLELLLELPDPGPRDFVRLVAHLADGRTIEDARVVSASGFSEQIDVHLVQLQVVVTNKQGLPLKGFRKEHFRIRENGRVREPAGLFVADEVTLLLGLALDSSGSMRRIWSQTRQAASAFLDRTLHERDRGFLVDFDTRLRLVRASTGDRAELETGLDELRPEGGTALYDSILFSLLQFDRQQGRRGLVVLTDGFDIDSQADPERAVEFGRKLGVPVYILAIEGHGPGPAAARRGIGTGIDDPAAAIQTLRLVTDPTGGQLYRVRNPDQVVRAFNHINAELRNQYVLTYYTDSPPEPGRPPEVEVEVPGHRGLRTKVVLGADQIY